MSEPSAKVRWWQGIGERPRTTAAGPDRKRPTRPARLGALEALEVRDLLSALLPGETSGLRPEKGQADPAVVGVVASLSHLKASLHHVLATTHGNHSPERASRQVGAAGTSGHSSKNPASSIATSTGVRQDAAYRTTAASGSVASTSSSTITPDAIRAAVVAQTVPGVYNIINYGADPTGATDSSPAFQLAINAAAAAGGGTVLVPAGTFSLLAPIVGNFQNQASSITLEGVGSGSILQVKGGSQVNQITLANIDQATVEDLTFVGTPGVATDAAVTLTFSTVNQAVIRDTQFYGIGTIVPGGSVVRAYLSSLSLEDSGFRGCSGNSGGGTPVVYMDTWTGFDCENCDFIDFGFLNNSGFEYTKVGNANALAWIFLGNVATSTWGTPSATIRNSRFDEGAYFAILANTTPSVSNNIAGVTIEDSLINGATANGALALALVNVDNITVDRVSIGLSRLQNATGVYILNSKNAVLNDVNLLAGMNTIAASNVGKLTVQDSSYKTLNSVATQTVVETPTQTTTYGPTGTILSSVDSNGNATVRSLSVGGSTVSGSVKAAAQVATSGALTLPSLTDSAAPNGTLFKGADHSNKLTYKDDSGVVHVLY